MTSNLLLAIDDVSLPLRKNVCLYLNKPAVRPEPVLSPSPGNAPDNLAANFYGTVLHDAGKFRMWYYALHRGKNPDWPPRKLQQVTKSPAWLLGTGYEIAQGPLCYAESDDGITWRKPALRQVLFKGNLDNNALDLPHTVVSGAAVIRDDTDPDPNRRYKMVYQFFPDQTEPVIPEFGHTPSIACATSPDGLQWTVTGLPYVDQFVEHCSFLRHAGRFIVHSQAFPDWSGERKEGGTGGGRTGVARSTYDFDRWPDLWEWAFALPEPADVKARGADNRYDQVHLGVGATSFGNVCVGLYGLWHSASFGDDYGKACCDLGLVVSNDGIRFREVSATPGQAYIHRDDSPATALPGRVFSTVLCQGNGILNVGNETRIYHGRWRNVGQKAEDIAQYYRADIALATLPRDRWGALALNPGVETGTICSTPVAGKTLTLNATGVDHITVDLLDETFRPISTGHRVTGPDGLDCPVQCELSSSVRVQVHLSGKARLYAINVQ